MWRKFPGLTLVNFETPYAIIATYPSYSGGKFLLNCLALSRHCYFQDINLVRQQQNGQLQLDQKIAMLLARLKKASDNVNEQGLIVWNDLELGDDKLFERNRLFDGLNTNLEQLSLGDRYFCLVAHNHIHHSILIGKFPRAFNIVWKNSTKFINWRLGLDLDFDRASDPALSQDWSAQEHASILQTTNTSGNRLFEWNTDWYFDKSKFLANLQKLYACLEFDDFDQESVEIFYKHYMATLDIIANQHRI